MKTKYYVEKGTICNYSQKGHYNFIYPDEKSTVFIDQQVVEKLSYVGGGEKIAVLAASNKLSNMVCSVIEEKIVVWIDKRDLKQEVT